MLGGHSMNPAGFNPEKGAQVVGTPDNFLQAVQKRFGRIVFDLACDGGNNVLGVPGFTPDDDALKRSWPKGPDWNWLNPPFKKSDRFTEKAHSEGLQGAKTLVLVRASIGAVWYQENVEGKAAVIPLRGRLMFKGESKPYPADLILCVYGLHGIIGMQPAWDWKVDLTSNDRGDAL